MNGLFVSLGIESWKAVLSTLLLPPVPLLVLILVGARWIPVRRGPGWLLLVIGVASLWLSACSGAAHAVSRWLLHPPAALSEAHVAELRGEAQNGRQLAIVVLGGGVEPFAPEYRASNLNWRSLERLHYGLWLARRTGAPVLFSGGLGWNSVQSMPEAQTAARIAAEDFGRPLKWVEGRSRDTHENAANSVALLKTAGITHIVLVTTGYHMPRALRAFDEAAHGAIRVEAASMGMARRNENPLFSWLPTSSGFVDMHDVLHEIAGRWAGA